MTRNPNPDRELLRVRPEMDQIRLLESVREVRDPESLGDLLETFSRFDLQGVHITKRV